MAIQKNESLQAMMDRLVPQGGVKPGGSSLSLAGAKPTTASVGSSPGKLQTSTAGNVSDREYFNATLGMAKDQQSYNREQDRLNRSTQVVNDYADRRQAFSDTMFQRDMSRSAFAAQEDQRKKDNAMRQKQAGSDNFARNVSLNQEWSRIRNQNSQARADDKLEKERIRTQSVIGKGQVGVERQRNELQFKAAELTDTTNKERIGADERIAKEQNQFGLFSNLMNSYASTKQRDPFGYLNI